MLEDVVVQASGSTCITSRVQSLQAASKDGGGTPDETSASEVRKGTPLESIDLISDEEDGEDDDEEEEDHNDDEEDVVVARSVDTRADQPAPLLPSSSSNSTSQFNLDSTASPLPVPEQAAKVRLKRQRQGGGVDLISQLLGGSSKSKVRKLDPIGNVAKNGNDGKGKERGFMAVNQKEKNGKRRVTWKADHLLEEVRLFHKSEEEKKEEANKLGLSHRDEGEVLRRKTELLDWYEPILVVLPLALQQESQKQPLRQSSKLVLVEEGEDHDDVKDHPITFDSDSPLETDIGPNQRRCKDQTGLLTETAEIAWPDILLDQMEGIECPDAVAESPDQLLLQDYHPRSLPPPPPPPPPPAEPRRSFSYEGRARHDPEKERDRRLSLSHHPEQHRRHSTDASHTTSSTRVSIQERREGGRHYDRERREGGQHSHSERARDRGWAHIPGRVQKEERVPIPGRSTEGRHPSDLSEEDRVVEERYGRRRSEQSSRDVEGRTERGRYEQVEERWHSIEYERRESWRYNEERGRERRDDRYRQWNGKENDCGKQDSRDNWSRRHSPTTTTTRGPPVVKSNETASTSKYGYGSDVWSSSPRRNSSSSYYEEQPRQTDYGGCRPTSSSSSHLRSTDCRSERKRYNTASPHPPSRDEGFERRVVQTKREN